MNRTGNRFTDRTGETSVSNQGYTMTIVEYRGALDMTITFNDNRGTIKKGVAYKEFKNGGIKNPYHKEVIGVGYMGEGVYTARVNGKMSKCYRSWFNMFNRCYNPDNNRFKTYQGNTVDEHWHNYQNFAEWFYNHYDPKTMKGWHLDKDLLSPGNKIYSPDTCVLIPNELNAIFKGNNESLLGCPRGVNLKDGKYQSSISKNNKSHCLGFFETKEEAHSVYMIAKKKHLEEVSEKWRGILSDKICDAIKNYDISLL